MAISAAAWRSRDADCSRMPARREADCSRIAVSRAAMSSIFAFSWLASVIFACSCSSTAISRALASFADSGSPRICISSRAGSGPWFSA